MKIAMISEHASPLAALGGPDAGGQNVHVAELSSALATAGHEVVVYTRRCATDQRHRVRVRPGVSVEHVTAGPVGPLPRDELLPHMDEFADRLVDSWRADPPDVVHAHFWMSGVAALRAAAEFPRLPVAQTFHALGAVKRRHQGAADTSPPTRVDTERRIATRVDRVIATCSDEVFELVRQGVPRRRVSIVPCGVDVAALHPQAIPDSRQAKHRLVVLGRLVPRKGIDDVVEALAKLTSSGPDTELVIAGGPRLDGLSADPDARRIRELARRCGVSERVRLVGGVQREAVAPLLASADAVVCVPWYEPFGIVPLEAMACGVAVVASAVGGLSDTVVDGVTGLHVPPRDPAQLAEALSTLLADPQRSAAMGAAGRDRAVSRYCWTRIASDTLRAYRRMRAAPRSATARPSRSSRSSSSSSVAGGAR